MAMHGVTHKVWRSPLRTASFAVQLPLSTLDDYTHACTTLKRLRCCQQLLQQCCVQSS